MKMFNNIGELLDIAKEKTGAKSDRRLMLMHMHDPSKPFLWRKKGVIPNDEMVLEIAKWAEVDPQMALLSLNYWRAQKLENPEVAEQYSKIEQILTQAKQQLKQSINGFVIGALLAAGTIFPGGPTLSNTVGTGSHGPNSFYKLCDITNTRSRRAPTRSPARIQLTNNFNFRIRPKVAA